MKTKAKNTFKDTKDILKSTLNYLKEDEPIIYCAAIAFFTIFSLPAILIVVTLVGIVFFDLNTIREEIHAVADEYIGDEAAEQIAIVLENVIEAPGSFWYIVIGVVVVVKSATMIFFMIQKALNSIWKVEVKKDVKYLNYLKHRSITLLIVVGLGFLLVLTLLLDTVVNIAGSELAGILPVNSHHTLTALNFALTFLMTLIFFTSIHKALPDAIIPWKDALAGGIITSILFIIGKQIINLILGSIEVADYYAAAGSLVVILLWIFYSSIILFLGGEITKAYSANRGHEIKPKSIAVKYSQTIELGEEG